MTKAEIPTRHSAKVYTIDPLVSFADSLAAGILKDYGHDALALSNVTILLPNRRAVIGLRDAFLRAGSDGGTMLLPDMRPIGDVDEDETTFLSAGLMPDPTSLKPAINAKCRQMLLMRQVSRWLQLSGQGEIAPAQAWRLSGELARLMDQIETERLSFDKLPDLVAEEFASHWQTTLEFLKIISATWPTILDSMGLMNPAQRRDAMMKILCDTWAASPPKGVVIAAGSTGTIRATADLLSVVSRLPNGMVILPGLDKGLDEDSWDILPETHPQYALKQLLHHMDVDRKHVEIWHEEPVAAHLTKRSALLSDTLLPSKTTHLWRTLSYAQDDKAELFKDFDVITAPGRREEAATIAMLMRDSLNVDGQTVALITPDRALASFVRAALGRWGLNVDDSAGERVIESQPGSVMSLVALVVAKEFSPVPILSLLQHPLVSAGMSRNAFRRFVRRLDRYVLRGPRPAAGIDGLLLLAAEAVAEVKNDFSAVDMATLTAVLDLMKPLEDAFKDGGGGVVILTAHIAVAENLCATDQEAGEAVLWRGEAGTALATELESLLDEAEALPPLSVEHYAPLYDEMVGDLVVRPVWRRHPRLYIWGPLEARLLRADVMILGGLNEGVWPMETRADPWMSRPMRKEFGLPSLERRIGQSAHDFVQAASAPKVIITRADKSDGSPAVPSRWLLRLEALVGGLPECHLPHALWAEAIDKPDSFTPVMAPEPRPPLDARPKSLSVTQVETWMRDPYALYAAKVLRLRKFDPIDAAPNAAQKGNIIHEALERFLGEEGALYGGSGLERMLDIGKQVFKSVIALPTVYAFWWPRFIHVAEWFVENQALRRSEYDVALIEKFAEATVDGTGFKLIAKADRIDRVKETGRLEIIDYKTGSAPSSKQVEAGFAPQMPLEGWLAERGAFEGLASAEVENLDFWLVKGGSTPVDVKSPIKDVRTAIDEAEEGLKRLISTFNKVETPYLSKPRPQYALYDDYDLLARVKEWRSGHDPLAPEGAVDD